MLYFLTERLQAWLDERGLASLVMVMFQLEFRAFLSLLLSFGAVLWAAPGVIKWLERKKVGDLAEFNHEQLNAIMRSRAGTPTMGGLVTGGAILATVLLLGDIVHSRTLQLAVLVLVWLGTVGAIDDWLKLTANRRIPGSRNGLLAWEKLLFQLGIGLVAGFFLYQASNAPDAHALCLPFQRSYPPTAAVDSIIQPPGLAPQVIVLGLGAFTLLCMLLVSFTSNAVNLTDGMDGLAASTLTVACFAFMALCWIAASPRAAYFLMVPHVPGAGELMVVAGAMAGANLGFLWFNASPARVFMGDTGSLPMGGLLAFIAMATRQEFLLILIGGVFYAEAASSMLQIGYYKWSRYRTGTPVRLFRCSPLHHHFHLGGWSEHQVVARAWILAVVLAMLALVSLKLR